MSTQLKMTLGCDLFRKSRHSGGKSGHATGRRGFFLGTFGVALTKEAITAAGDIFVFSVVADLAMEVPLLSGVTEVPGSADGGFEGCFFVISS